MPQIPIIFPQIEAALKHCYFRGVWHTDLKLENFIYDFDTGLVKLNDFGQAELVHGELKTETYQNFSLHSQVAQLVGAAPQIR